MLKMVLEDLLKGDRPEKKDSSEGAGEESQEHPLTHEQLSQALEASEIKYRRLFESAKDGILILDASTGAIEDVNPFLTNLLGYPAEEFIGRKLWEIGTFKDIAANQEKFKKLQQEEYVRYEHLPLETANGQSVAVEFVSNIYLSDNREVIQCNIRDITARKGIEEELRHTNSFLDSIIENIPIMVFLKDARDLTFVRFNKAGEDITGVREEELLLKTDYDFVSKEQADSFVACDRKVLQEKIMVDIPEEPIFTRYNGTRILHTRKVPILDAQGEPTHLLGISADITERKQVEEALHENNERLAKFSEQVPGAIYQFKMEPNGIFTIPFASKMMHSIFGIPPQREGYDAAVVFSQTIPEDLEELYRSIKESAMSMEPWHHSFRINLPDGLHWVEGNSQPERLPDGSVMWYGFVNDITERKEAEVELINEKMLLKAELDTCPDGILVVDQTGRIIKYNANLKRLWDIPQEILDTGDATSLMEYARAHLKEPAGFLSKVEHLYERTAPKSDGEINFIDGRCFERYSAPLIDAENTYHGRIWFFHDVTTRTNLENALVEKERLSAMGELASGVAHDFNNTLQAIFGNTELALHESDLPLAVSKYLATIKATASDAAMRVQQIQRFAGKTKTKSEHAALDLATILDQAIEQAKPKWKAETEKNGLEIRIQRMYAATPTIDGNAGELGSAFYNLIKNSIEAMPEGGELTFETGTTEEQVYLRITDTGMGMDEETQKRIYQPFYTTKGFDVGRGLGMSAVYSIIRDHRGEIHIKESAPGEGTTFEILLPYGSLAAQPTLEETLRNQERAANILWVDDDDIIREAGKEMLQLLGHRPTLAASGAEALHLLETNNYDLIITDVGMPKMSGWQLAEQIKTRYAGSKVAVLTGWGADVTDEDKQRYGVAYVLGKPIGMDDLGNLIEEALQTPITIKKQ